jgi:hypothetical protein
VFAVLLQMVPNLEAQLMEGNNEDVVLIADMVRYARSFPQGSLLLTSLGRFNEVYPVLDLMILRA